MDNEIRKLFVYGTLLKGEIRSNYLNDTKLLDSIEIPGEIYDTEKGYPAAAFCDNSNSVIAGELYDIGSMGERLMHKLDMVEGTNIDLFKRTVIEHNNSNIVTYIAGRSLEGKLIPENRIKSGSWRQHASISKIDAVGFALNFENSQKLTYKEHPSQDSNGLIYLKGGIPILITAPHATAHFRLNKLKRQEFYTGAISNILHSITGCHALYTNRLSELDPNYYDNSDFKITLKEILHKFNIQLVIDIHGTGTGRIDDIFPGTGNQNEFLLGKEDFVKGLFKCAASCKITVGSFNIYPALKQDTIAKFAARKMKIPAIQLEINRKLSEPKTNPVYFERLVKFLSEYVSLIGGKPL